MGERIRRKRREVGMTQKQLAKAVGVSQSAVAMWERDENKPRVDMLGKLAQLFNCGIAELFEDMMDKRKGIDSTGGEAHV